MFVDFGPVFRDPSGFNIELTVKLRAFFRAGIPEIDNRIALQFRLIVEDEVVKTLKA